MRLPQNKNESIKSILQYGNVVRKKLFCGIHCFMISICDVAPQFSNGIKRRYHLLFHTVIRN